MLVINWWYVNFSIVLTSVDVAVAFRNYHMEAPAAVAYQIDPLQHPEVADDIDWVVEADFDADTHPLAHVDDRMGVDVAHAAFDTILGHLSYVHELCDVHHALTTMMTMM